MVSPGSLIMSMKAVLISAGVLAVALILKIYVPIAMDFSVSTAPIIWSSLLLWLKPPYLYVIINAIIISIAASSRNQRSNREEKDTVDMDTARKIQTEQIFLQSPPQKATEISVDPVMDFGYETVKDLPASIDRVEPSVEIVHEPMDEEENAVVVENAGLMEDDVDETVVSTSTRNPPKRTDSLEIAPSEDIPAEEKPLVSARFGHRKAPKSSPEGGRRLKVAKPKRPETLENTWKMLTDGRSMPLTKHLRKSDTWENRGRHFDVDASVFNKSETFKDRTNYQPPQETTKPSPVKMRKEPSLSQDELNRRVEAFIKKFNEEMRLQRAESIRQYKEMISHGV